MRVYPIIEGFGNALIERTVQYGPRIFSKSAGTGGGFYRMPTTGTIFIGSHQTLGVSADGHTIVGVTRDNCGIQQAAIWLRATEWPLLGGFPNALPCIDI